MTNRIIERNTGIFWKSIVSDTRGNTPVRENKIIHNMIEFFCGNTSFNIRTNHIECHCCEFSSFANPRDLLGSFYNNSGVSSFFGHNKRGQEVFNYIKNVRIGKHFSWKY